MQLEFLNPAGAGTGELFPTGELEEVFDVPGIGNVRGSVVDAANLCCFLRADDLGLKGTEMPSYLDGQEKLTQAMRNISIQIRDRIMSRLHPKHKVRIGLIGFVSPPQTAQTLSDDPIAVEDSNFTARMYSSLQPHRALPLTSSMCMATARKITTTLAPRSVLTFYKAKE